MNRHLARRTLELDACARVFVQGLAVALERGIHRRHLLDVTTKVVEHGLERSALDRHRPGRDDLAFGVATVGLHAQLYHRLVSLVGVEQHLRELGRLAEGERQQTGRHRVERTGVTGLGGVEQAARCLQRPVRAHPLRLVEQQYAVDDPAQDLALRLLRALRPLRDLKRGTGRHRPGRQQRRRARSRRQAHPDGAPRLP